MCERQNYSKLEQLYKQNLILSEEKKCNNKYSFIRRNARVFYDIMTPGMRNLINPFFSVWSNKKVENINLSLVNEIRKEDFVYLTNPLFLETVFLPRLGFNNEHIYQFPDVLHKYCGRGLKHWQYPNQFSKYLVFLSKLNIKSYLEIGVRWGGTFIITVEYLNRFNKIKKAVGIDIIDCPPGLKKYQKMNPVASYHKLNTQSEQFKRFMKNDETSFDLALIDGNHTKNGVVNDFLNLRKKVKILAFHDIASDACYGVRDAWQQIKKKYHDQYTFIEFKQQYNEIKNVTKMNYLGIGLMIKKGRLKW